MKFYTKALDENLAHMCFLTVLYEGNKFTFIKYDGVTQTDVYSPEQISISNWYNNHLSRLS